MPKLAVEYVLFLVGTALTIILLVLDKAGKLKGPMLLVLLAVAATLMLPVALGNSWVVDANSGMLKFSRSILCLFTVGLIYAGLAVWVSTQEAPHSEQRIVSQPETIVEVDVKELRSLYVQLSEITQERRKAYIELYAAQVQIAIDTNSIENPTFSPQERTWLQNKINKEIGDQETRLNLVYEVEQKLAKLLATITLALPENQEASGLLSAAAVKPTYEPKGLSSREWKREEVHRWIKVQEPIATQSVREQSNYPLEALARYVNGIINTYEKRQ